MDKKERKLTSFEHDNIWMSTRYCIGRHTIAAYCHAEDIATNTYHLMCDDERRFFAKDINHCIYDQLHYNDFCNMGWYGNIPDSHFKPLCALYSAMYRYNIDSYEKVRQIKNIALDWDGDLKEYKSEITYQDIIKTNHREIHDLNDLEVWQQLANLFDVDSHKWCKLTNGDIVEYFEYMVCQTYGGEFKYITYKCPIQKDISFRRIIPLESIEEDNVKKPNK